MERTFVLFKPDCMTRSLLGPAISRFEQKGLRLVAMKMIKLDDNVLDLHYAHLKAKPFFPSLVKFMKSTPVVATVWEGVDAVNVVRVLLGVTNGRNAAPGTIRGDLSMSTSANLVHASDSIPTAADEIKRFFKADELYEWAPVHAEFFYAPDEAAN